MASTGRRRRTLPGVLRDVWYRVVGRGPPPAVNDRVLRERIRSTLGPLERRLGVGEIAVSVSQGAASLSGASTSEADAAAVVAAVAAIPGVTAVTADLVAPTGEPPDEPRFEGGPG